MKNNMLLMVKVMFELEGLDEQVKRTKMEEDSDPVILINTFHGKSKYADKKNNIERVYNCYFDSDMD